MTEPAPGSIEAILARLARLRSSPDAGARAAVVEDILTLAQRLSAEDIDNEGERATLRVVYRGLLSAARMLSRQGDESR